MSNRNRLKDILAEHGSTQTWLAKKAGVSVAAVNDLVLQRRSPSLDTARKIAQALECEISEIWPLEKGEK